MEKTIRVDTEVFDYILEHKARLEIKRRTIVSMREALKDLLGISTEEIEETASL